jgi:hypothetical protein
VNPDPDVRADGLCVVCERPVRPERWAKYARGVTDPFCSTECCRAWHGCPRRAGGPHAGELSREPLRGRSPDRRVGDRGRYVRKGAVA